MFDVVSEFLMNQGNIEMQASTVIFLAISNLSTLSR